MQPRQQDLNAINIVIDTLNDYAEKGCTPDDSYFVDLLPKRFRLTMAQVQDRSSEFWVIKPCWYEELEPLTQEDLELYTFEEFQGDATTGSSSYIWGVYQPGLLEALEELVKQCEKIAEEQEDEE